MPELRDRRFTMMMAPSEVGAIEAYRWKNKIGSTAKAARELIATGLSAIAVAEKAERPGASTPSRP